MVGSIDPRCETVRGIHWPKKGREVVWSSRRGNHLGQRPKATASTGRTYGCKRSDQTLKKLLWHGGRPHMGPGSRFAWPGRRGFCTGALTQFSNSQTNTALRSRGAMRPSFAKSIRPKKTEGAGNAGCPMHRQPRVRNKTKHTSVVTTGSPDSFRHSPRNGFNGFLRALPGDQACLTPSSALLLADLTPASGRQNHTTSPYASRPRSSRALPRPPHPAPRS